jgi:preprotein translocase subunit YajC
MLIPNAYAQSTAAQPQGGGWFLPIMMIGVLLFMYFTTIRPQRKRQKEHEAMVSSLNKGDEVMMSSGMLGKVVGLEDHYLLLNVANNVDLKFQRLHVTAVLPKGTLKSIGAE